MKKGHLLSEEQVEQGDLALFMNKHSTRCSVCKAEEQEKHYKNIDWIIPCKRVAELFKKLIADGVYIDLSKDEIYTYAMTQKIFPRYLLNRHDCNFYELCVKAQAANSLGELYNNGYTYRETLRQSVSKFDAMLRDARLLFSEERKSKKINC